MPKLMCTDPAGYNGETGLWNKGTTKEVTDGQAKYLLAEFPKSFRRADAAPAAATEGAAGQEHQKPAVGHEK